MQQIGGSTKPEFNCKAELKAKREGQVRCKSEQETKAQFLCKAEVRAKLQPGVKAEHPAMKAEVRTKLQPGMKDEHPALKLERKLGVKVEQRSNVQATSAKAEPVNSPSSVASLLQRGMKLREMAERAKKKMKREQGGKRGRVKKERSGSSRKRGGKRRVTAARRNASRDAMKREVPLSAELSEVLGVQALSRPETVKRLWAHCRDRGMQNPEDKREILFDDKLSSVLGRPSARMTDLFGLLTPHFDYTGQVKTEGGACPKVENKPNVKDLAKEERKAKFESKVEQKTKVQLQAKGEQKTKCESGVLETMLEEVMGASAGVKAQLAKTEQSLGRPHGEIAVVKRQKREQEQVPQAVGSVSLLSVEDEAAAITPRLSNISRNSVVVEFRAPSGRIRFEAIALPASTLGTSSASGNVVRQACTVEVREDPQDGSLEPHGEALLEGLDPSVPYRVCVEVISDASGGASAQSPAVGLPQRASPAKWTTGEVLLWCSSLKVPELARKAKDYGIDGTTLLALGEEDLLAFGLAAPFLRTRVLTALQKLREAAH